MYSSEWYFIHKDESLSDDAPYFSLTHRTIASYFALPPSHNDLVPKFSFATIMKIIFSMYVNLIESKACTIIIYLVS